MKRIFILMFLVANFINIYAQQETTTIEGNRLPYKFQKGAVATELNFSFISLNFNSDGENFTTVPIMPGLKLRVGLNNKWAFRANMQLDFGHNKINNNLDFNDEGNYWKIVRTGTSISKNNYTQFTLAPGFEYHFGMWERLSIYVGGEVLVGFRVSQGSFELDSRELLYQRDYYNNLELVRTTEIKGNIKTKNCYYSGSNYEQTGRMFFGINALTGFDFYFYKGLFLGAELGLGYTHSYALKGTAKGEYESKIKTPNGGSTNFDTIDEIFDTKISGGNFGFRCNPMIRLGWRF